MRQRCQEKTLSNRVAIVTGAASGIGRATAQALAQQGHQLVIADLPQSAGQELAASLNGLFVDVDLTQRSECRKLIDRTIEHYGRVDIVVNNAGFQHIDSIVDFPEDTWERMQALMVTAPFLLTKYSFTDMQSRGWGRYVNISSINGLIAMPFKSGYVAAKHGLIGLTRTTALEGGAHGITANALCPAYVRTPLVENQIEAQARTRNISPEDVISTVMLQNTAIKRLIEPEEVGSLVAYLCSDAAAVVTGAAWTIDLGWTAQ
jgi:3-hydroxybutyrate dehydrogenase